jgi:hypothetical protein
MTTTEKTVALAPPTSRITAALAREQAALRELAALRLQIAECVLAYAEAKPRARENLAELHRKILLVEFEIAGLGAARDLAARLDTEAYASWKADIQTLPLAEIVAGISIDECCRRCRPGECVIAGADPGPSECCHPRKIGSLNLLRHQANEQIRAVYSAAVAKVGRR